MSLSVNRPWLTPTRLIVLSFAATILAGTILLMLPIATSQGISPPVIDALFTATSAVCVTGLVVVNTASYWSLFGKIVIMLLIQVGGLGLMTFATAHLLFTGKKIGLKHRLILQEQTGQWSLSGLVVLLRRILLETLIFELCGAIILAVAIGVAKQLSPVEAAFHGIFHAVSAFCNAGFDILGNSLVDFVGNPAVILTISGLIIFGGLGFHVLADIYAHRARWSELSLHSRMAIKATVGLLLIGTVVVMALEHDNPDTLGNLSLKDRLLAAWFQSVTPRTAGFNSIPTEKLLPGTALFVIVLMFIGASPGGTGGGIKTTTFVTTAGFVISAVRGGGDVTFEKRRLPGETIEKALAITLIAVSLVVTATFVLSITEQGSFLDILFEVVSAFGTVGLSRGLTPYLSTTGKLVLILTMFAGRVGPLSLAIALSGQKKSNIRYPEEKVTVG